jgi:hypothetical protein
MIYEYVTTPTDARDAMVDFYQNVLCDEIADNQAELTTPAAYLEEVRAHAYSEPTDDYGHDLKDLILKATEQPTTLKALTKEYEEAKSEPQDFVRLRK